MPTRPPVTFLIAYSIDYGADYWFRGWEAKSISLQLRPMAGLLVMLHGFGVEISDPTGRAITDENIAKVYQRSAMLNSAIFPQVEFSELDRYAEEEVYAAWSDLLISFGSGQGRPKSSRWRRFVRENSATTGRPEVFSIYPLPICVQSKR